MVGIILSSKPSPYISHVTCCPPICGASGDFGEAGEQNASVKDKGDNEEVQAEVAEDDEDLSRIPQAPGID